MRRRSRASSKLANARSRKQATLKRRSAPKVRGRATPDQETEVTRLARELNEALERHTATTEILKIISASPTELQSVLEVVVKSAARFCEADDVTIFELDGHDMRMAAHWGSVPYLGILEIGFRFPCSRGSVAGRTVIDRKPVHVIDLQAEAEEFPEGYAFARRLGHRTTAGVPLLREGVAIGAIQLRRTEVNPFTDKQLALLGTFGAQAVIAIENTRLLSELRQRTNDLTESLEQQTATSEVLRVISSSPSELTPVFESILENATRLCDANFGTLNLHDNGSFPLVAAHNAPKAYVEYRRHHPLVKLGPQHPLARVAASKQVLQIADLKEEPLYREKDPSFMAMPDLAGTRTLFAVPMLKDDELLGAITIFRQEIRPFTEKQIALVQNFAAQAVIAIDNTRLLNELRQSLEQQTATADVLRVISSSPGELEPVFQAMLENAVRICEAKFGTLFLRDVDVFRGVATHNAPPAYVEALARAPIRPPPDVPLGIVAATKQVAYVSDITTTQSYIERHPFVFDAVELGGYRSVLAVPMFKDNELVGSINILGKEVRPFSDKQIALVQNFAAQAVIAIENTRLLNELRQRTADLSESLEQQTATSEILKVISSSPGELESVFQTILANATRICTAKFGTLYLYDGDSFHFGAEVGSPPAYGKFQRQRGAFRPQPGTHMDRIIRTKQISQTADATAEPVIGPVATIGGARSFVGVPMLKDDKLIGMVGVYRQEVRPFNEKQIDLVKNFAAQAVIAIENARLLNELRESLQQQTATADVLKVISRSTFDLQIVLHTLAKSAMDLCEADVASMWRPDGNVFKMAVNHGYPEEFEAFSKQNPIALGRETVVGRVALQGRAVQIPDVLADHEYSMERQSRGDYRSLLGVPLLKEGETIGVFALGRCDPKPFTDKQIELVTTFADQAVIAIENARLLNELRQRTSDLTESLEQQTATAEVLRVISSSPGELEPVFNAMLEKAVHVCEAKFGVLFRHEGGMVRPTAMLDVPPAYAEFLIQLGAFAPQPGQLFGRICETKKVIHIVDRATEQPQSPSVKYGGSRSCIAVPMLKANELIGAFFIYRAEVRPFTDRQIELVQNFAAQAVIAIENTRLLNELRQRTEDLTETLEQQTATSKVLEVISRSAFDLQAVFETVAESSVKLCGSERANIFRFDGEVLRGVASFNASQKLMEWLEQNPIRPGRHSVAARAALEHKTVQVADVLDDPEHSYGAKYVEPFRTVLGVPILKGDDLLGIILVYHTVVRPFTDKQIALVETFADQAAIAIDNVRLLDELQQSLQQQTATADVLKIISRSTFDLKSVLHTLLESAARLCEADMASVPRLTGTIFDQVASYGYSPRFHEFMQGNPILPGRGTASGRAVAERKTIQIPDVLADPHYDDRYRTEGQKVGGFRTLLGVPLMRGGAAIGALVLGRSAPRPFTPQQIELVETFADQAVIAIENVRLFDEIQDKSRQLEEASQHKSQFLANMSHELRTPLNAILGYTELMADGAYGEPSDKMLGILKRLEANGKHLLGLINDVLDLSKIEAGQLVLELSDYCIQDIAQTVRSTLEPLASDKKLGFKLEMAGELPPGHGDGRRLTQVLINLVGNAIKFTDTGEVAIKAEAHNGLFHVSVRDTGPGISSADQAKLFQEFQQADNAITKKKGGTGLGLAISKRIIEMHGGRIWVESQPGQGSTFTFTLPVIVERQVEAA